MATAGMQKAWMVLVLSLAMMAMLVERARGHGRLMKPVQRSSRWRDARYPSAPENYNDHQLFCGGFAKQWDVYDGKCGVCGDAYDAPHPQDNEANGKYGQGVIVETYTQGQTINVMVTITSNHKGYFVFKLCPNNDIHKAVTQECLDRRVLNAVDANGNEVDKYFIGSTKGDISLRVRLPGDVTCSQCVFQWTYNTGNSYGCFKNKTCCIGCGPQENFVNCADVAITSKDAVRPLPAPSGTKTPPATTAAQGCRAVPPYDNSPQMHDWCVTHCAAGDCPASHCICT